MSTYYPVTAEEMRDFLKIEKGWIETVSSNEIVFDFALKAYPFIIVRVCSGIRRDTQASRKVGKDAIRIYAFNSKTNCGWISTVRTYRTEGWKNNLKERIFEVIADANARCDSYKINQIKNSARVASGIQPVQNKRVEMSAILKSIEQNIGSNVEFDVAA